MIKVTYDEENDILTLTYSGEIDAAQSKQLYTDIQKLSPKLKKGFKILADLSRIQSMAPETLDAVKKAMDFFDAHGVSEIIRIIPYSRQDFGLNILSLFHYSKEVKYLTVSSQDEANPHVRVWSTKKKIAFMEMKDAWQKDFLKDKFPGKETLFFDETAQEKVKDLNKINILSVFINSKVDKKLIDQLPALQLITTRSTGFDHIDLKAAEDRGIQVCNVPTYGENTVAEHTFALILSLSRNLRKAYLRTAQDNFSLEGLMGFDLKGKTVGVIGTGHIGLHVIRMALGFGMKVLAFDIKKQSFLSEVLNFEYVSLEELLKRSDILTLHAPYLPSTKHLINKNNIGLIKKGAVLVNTARGGLIQTDALVEALDKKILAGAGLDVLEEEECVLEEKRLLEGTETKEQWERQQRALKNYALLHRENVIFTPHIAFYSREGVQRILETTVDNIQAFLQGRRQNEVVKV